MSKETISDKQAFSIIILFIIGESSIFIWGLEAERDLWISIIISILLAFPLVLIFARLHSIFPGKNLFDIIEMCFGKYIGKVFIALYTCFSLDLTALALLDYGYFVNTTSFPETPILAINIPLIFVCAYYISKGIEVLGRSAEIFVTIPIIFISITILLLIPEMDINNIRPILYKGIQPVFEGVFRTLSFPFGYMVGLTLAISGFKTKKSPYKSYSLGLFIGGIIVFATSFSDILVLGVAHTNTLYYPTYTAASRINIGYFFQRVEIFSSTVFFIGGIVEISIWLLSACKGITKLFGIADYRFIILPVTLLVINLSTFEFKSIMHYFEWSEKVWPYYVFPFEVIFPIIIWITAEFKIRKVKIN